MLFLEGINDAKQMRSRCPHGGSSAMKALIAHANRPKDQWNRPVLAGVAALLALGLA